MIKRINRALLILSITVFINSCGSGNNDEATRRLIDSQISTNRTPDKLNGLWKYIIDVEAIKMIRAIEIRGNEVTIAHYCLDNTNKDKPEEAMNSVMSKVAITPNEIEFTEDAIKDIPMKNLPCSINYKKGLVLGYELKEFKLTLTEPNSQGLSFEKYTD